jgi:hypothetical protein
MRTKFWSGNLKGRDHSEDLGVDGEVLESVLGKEGGRRRLDSFGSGYGPVVGSCERGGEFLD